MRHGISELQQAWKDAIKFEQDSRERYLKVVALATDASIKSLFEYLAGEELKHQHLLEDEYQKAFEPEM